MAEHDEGHDDDLELDDDDQGPLGGDDDEIDDEGAAGEDDPAGGDDDDAPKNRWAARRSMSEMLAESERAPKRSARTPTRAAATTDDDEDDDEDDDDREEKDDLEDDDDEDEGDEDDEEGQTDKKATPPKGDAGAGDTRRRYAIVDEQGKSFEFEFKKGTSLTFKGDGREIRVGSLNELVQYAEKGAGFDTKVSTLSTERDTLRGERDALQQEREQIEDRAEQLLLTALYGTKEQRLALRAELKDYRRHLDPEYREGVKARAREQERTAQEKQQQEQETETARKTFWTKVGESISELAPRYPHLDPESDAERITQTFYKGYEAEFHRAYSELKAGGASDAAAKQGAQQQAWGYFTEKNLRRAMRAVDREIEQALAKRGAKKVVDPKAKDRAERGARRHNAETDSQLTRRRRSQHLRGSGSGAPANRQRGAAGQNPKPRTFTQRMDSAFKMLREAGSDAS